VKDLLIIGGVGAASTIAAAVVDAEKRGASEYRFAGYINDKDGLNEIGGYPVRGGLQDSSRLARDGYYLINTVYKIDGQVFRVNLFDLLQIPAESLARFVHPMAFVAPDVTLGPGCVIMPNASVSSGAVLGLNCRVMAGAMVGHDTVLADHSFLAAQATIGSHVATGKAAYFGLNCTVGGHLRVGQFAVVGMGAVVTGPVGEYEIWAGNPARYRRHVKDSQIALGKQAQ